MQNNRYKLIQNEDGTLTEEGKKRGWEVYLPEFKFTTDNAAMIAIAGWFHYQNGTRTSLDVAPVSRLAEF